MGAKLLVTGSFEADGPVLCSPAGALVTRAVPMLVIMRSTSRNFDRYITGGANVTNSFDPEVPPSGTGCVECLEAGGWWLHLRRCAECGHIGCCDNSPSQHATAHAKLAGHAVIRSFEPGEDWFWNYQTNKYIQGPRLAPPEHHPLDQPVPGPAGRVPANWQDLLVG